MLRRDQSAPMSLRERKKHCLLPLPAQFRSDGIQTKPCKSNKCEHSVLSTASQDHLLFLLNERFVIRAETAHSSLDSSEVQPAFGHSPAQSNDPTVK